MMKLARDLGLLILAGLAVWFAYHGKDAANRAAAKLAFLEADRVTSRKAVADLTVRLNETKARFSAEAPDKFRAPPEAPPPAKEVKEKARSSDLLSLLAEHPELTALMIRAKASQLDLRWPGFFAALKLTPEQSEQFQSIQLAHEESVNGLLVAARMAGMTSSDPDFRDMGKEVFDQTRNQLVALIGADGFKKMQEFSRTIAVQEQTRELAGLLYASEPLSAQQGEQVTQIFLENTLQSTVVDGRVVAPRPEAYQAALARASKVLSPNQFVLFQSKITAMQATQELAEVASSISTKKP